MGVKKAEESNVTRERLPRTSPDYSSPFDSSLFKMSASLKPPRCGTCSLVCFCFVEVCFFSFCFVLCWPQLKHVHLGCYCNTIAFLWSSSLHTVSARGSVISLANSFLSWHISLWRCDMFINEKILLFN